MLVAAGLALVLCASASASLHSSEQDIVYTPTTLPAGDVGTAYDVTMTAKYPASAGGGYASLGTATQITTSSEAAPGILFRAGKVPDGSSLELIGTPTAPGTFHFTSAVVFSDGSGVTKQWTLVVTGKAQIPPAEAKKLESDVDDEIAYEREAIGDIGNDADDDTAARRSVGNGSLRLANVVSTLEKYALPSGYKLDPESAVQSAEDADGDAYDVMGGHKTGLKLAQATADFSHSKELQAKALNFIAQAIAAKKRASTDLSILASQ